MGCLPRIPILLLVILALLPSLAVAQFNPVPSIRVEPESVALGPSQTEEFTATVRNDGPRPAQTTVTFTNVPSGWDVTFVDPSQRAGFAVNAGQEVPVRLRAATAADEAEPVDGTPTFTVTMMNDLNQPVSASDTADFDYVAPVIPPPPPAPEDYTGLIVGLVLGVLILLAVAFYLYDSGTVRVTAEAMPPITVGSSGTALLDVTNTGKRERNVQLRMRGVPAGWAAAFAFPMVHLQPGESTRVPLNVKAATALEAGRPGRIRVQARPAPYALWIRGTDVETTTHEVESPSTRPASRPIMVPPTKPVFTGDVAKVIDIEGIGPTFAAQLQEIGITDTQQLLAASPAEVTQKTGIAEALVNTWQAMADLIRVKGIGKQYAELLARAGITGVGQLAQETPEGVVKQVEDYLSTVERPPTHGRVVESRVQAWIEAAQDLEAEGAHFSKMMTGRGRHSARAAH